MVRTFENINLLDDKSIHGHKFSRGDKMWNPRPPHARKKKENSWCLDDAAWTRKTLSSYRYLLAFIFLFLFFHNTACIILGFEIKSHLTWLCAISFVLRRPPKRRWAGLADFILSPQPSNLQFPPQIIWLENINDKYKNTSIEKKILNRTRLISSRPKNLDR